MTFSKLCTVSLFMKDTENVKNYCKTESEPNSISIEHIMSLMGCGLYYSEYSQIHCSLPSQTKENSNCKPTLRYNQTKHVLYCYQ